MQCLVRFFAGAAKFPKPDPPMPGSGRGWVLGAAAYIARLPRTHLLHLLLLAVL
jgi:hypothetical protein